MKIKKRTIRKLIKNALLEAGTGPTKGSPGTGNNKNDEFEDDFELTDDMLDADQSAYEEYVRAVDAYRNPHKPVGNFPHLFKDKTPHIPTEEELEHVRRYQSQEIGGAMPSVDDHEVTIPNFGEDEDTEESPFGTQYSMEETEPQYSYEKTLTDPGHTAYSDDDFYLDSEDEDTDDEEEIGLMQRIRDGFKKIQKKYF